LGNNLTANIKLKNKETDEDCHQLSFLFLAYGSENSIQSPPYTLSYISFTTCPKVICNIIFYIFWFKEFNFTSKNVTGETSVQIIKKSPPVIITKIKNG